LSNWTSGVLASVARSIFDDLAWTAEDTEKDINTSRIVAKHVPVRSQLNPSFPFILESVVCNAEYVWGYWSCLWQPGCFLSEFQDCVFVGRGGEFSNEVPWLNFFMIEASEEGKLISQLSRSVSLRSASAPRVLSHRPQPQSRGHTEHQWDIHLEWSKKNNRNQTIQTGWQYGQGTESRLITLLPPSSSEFRLWEQKMIHRLASQRFSQITEHVEPVYVYKPVLHSCN